MADFTRAEASDPISAPYGTWRSPLAAETVAAGALRLGAVVLDGADLYWIEGRPAEGGRSVVVRRSADGRVADATPPRTNVRTRVHEYGGGAYCVSRDTIYFVEFADQRIYRLAPGSSPEPVTPAGGWRYADCDVHPSGSTLVCVREDHTVEDSEAVTTIVTIPLDGTMTAGQVIVSGHDFYSTPRFSPDGARLSWLAWRHPNMPWDGSEVWVGELTPDGALERTRPVAGDASDAIFQPGWSPDGTLYFVSDRTGWWNLYRLRDDRIESVLPMDVDFGRPQWQFGMSTWAFADPSRIAVTFQERGRWRLGVIDLNGRTLRRLCPDVEPGESIVATSSQMMFVAGFAADPDAVVAADLATGAVHTIRAAPATDIPRGLISVAEDVEVSTTGGLKAYGFYYGPRNPRYAPPDGARPPLIVISHGGPTASTSTRLSLEIQYWTSRGFGVVDVNYGGSSGYGREYRRRLNGTWGVVDIDDCINAAKSLAAEGKADPERLIIRGRSAGGYTTLAALTFRPDVFRAGASYFGISDLEAMTRETHKFESRYLDTLLGPYPAMRDVYRARSPIHFISRLACPIIFFQGLEDRVVPPNQSELMADEMRGNGVPVALLTFEGEQHGFRKAETIIRCLEAELSFYGAVLGLGASTVDGTLTIDNLDQWLLRPRG
jgi:dipeptidyl aminopeptidase/acylaminoacyl peptidase